MTTVTEAREALYDLFFDNFTGLPAAQLTRDNEKFDPPEKLPWARFAVRHFPGGGQESLGDVGNRKFDRIGSAFTQFFIPQRTGVRAADVLAQEFRTLFEGVNVSGTTIRLNTVEIREGGLTDGYFMVVGEANFRYTETK